MKFPQRVLGVTALVALASVSYGSGAVSAADNLESCTFSQDSYNWSGGPAPMPILTSVVPAGGMSAEVVYYTEAGSSEVNFLYSTVGNVEATRPADQPITIPVVAPSYDLAVSLIGVGATVTYAILPAGSTGGLDTPLCSYTVTLAEAPVDTTAPGTTAPRTSAPAPELPETGSNSSMILWGAAMATLGGALLAFRRRTAA